MKVKLRKSPRKLSKKTKKWKREKRGKLENQYRKSTSQIRVLERGNREKNTNKKKVSYLQNQENVMDLKTQSSHIEKAYQVGP